MDWTALILGLISSVSAVGVAAIAALQIRHGKQQEIRDQRDTLQINLIATTLDLALISAKKLCNHETNGEVEKAMLSAADAQLQYKKFCERTVQII